MYGDTHNCRYALSTVAVEEGIRVYVKTSAGLIREICHNVSTAGLQEALAYGNRSMSSTPCIDPYNQLFNCRYLATEGNRMVSR